MIMELVHNRERGRHDVYIGGIIDNNKLTRRSKGFAFWFTAGRASAARAKAVSTAVRAHRLRGVDMGLRRYARAC